MYGDVFLDLQHTTEKNYAPHRLLKMFNSLFEAAKGLVSDEVLVLFSAEVNRSNHNTNAHHDMSGHQGFTLEIGLLVFLKAVRPCVSMTSSFSSLTRIVGTVVPVD
uniref:Uncharacterized protein n=1 Tax=Rhipicephalus zambeziensis TaxID=60191 RepID=A0A224Y8H0_9ACAR